MHLLTPFVLFVSATALPSQSQWQRSQRAIYTLSNDPAGANILSLVVSDNGTVSSPVLTPTGGKGQLGVNAGPPEVPAGPDSLFSQGSVLVSGNYLFTVNAGSNTLSMFRIDANDVSHPKLVGTPADTMGDFPISVDYSDRLRQACVVNGGAKNGVACFSVSDQWGLHPIGNLHPLKDLHTTTPPVGFPDTAADIQFNPSSTAVFVTIKGNPGPPAVPGFIYAFPVDRWGQLSQEPVISSPPQFTVDFTINFLSSDSCALLTDPSFGASIIAISPDYKVSERIHIAIPGQGANCWATYSPWYDAAYTSDAAKPNITVINPQNGDIKATIQFEAGGKGGFDSAINGQWLYVLAGDSSIVVLDLQKNQASGSQQVQHFELAGLGPATDWTGMAAYPA